MQLNAQLGLAFATASQLNCLTLLHKTTRRIIMQKARRHLTGSRRIRIWLRQLVSAWFQVLFHSPPGVLFTFPSRYWFTIGRQRVFSLAGWSPRLPTGFHVSRGTRERYKRDSKPFAYGAITRCGRPFQGRSARLEFCNSSTPLHRSHISSHDPGSATRAGLNTLPV